MTSWSNFPNTLFSVNPEALLVEFNGSFVMACLYALSDIFLTSSPCNTTRTKDFVLSKDYTVNSISDFITDKTDLYILCHNLILVVKWFDKLPNCWD